MENDRRVSGLRIRRQQILELFNAPNQALQVRYECLPKDAEVVNAWFEYETDSWVLAIRSETFAPLPEGHHIPFLTLTAETKPKAKA